MTSPHDECPLGIYMPMSLILSSSTPTEFFIFPVLRKMADYGLLKICALELGSCMEFLTVLKLILVSFVRFFRFSDFSDFCQIFLLSLLQSLQDIQSLLLSSFCQLLLLHIMQIVNYCFFSTEYCCLMLVPSNMVSDRTSLISC